MSECLIEIGMGHDEVLRGLRTEIVESLLESVESGRKAGDVGLHLRHVGFKLGDVRLHLRHVGFEFRDVGFES